jgi:GNAT superfamily N-acetyltransferase
MKTKITNLSDTSLSELTRCFNESFSDYFVKFNATENYLAKRWKIGRVNFDLSFGYFVDDVLRGFIIHGIDMRDGKLTAHNCATGIEPAYRGKGILGEIYQAAIPALLERNINFSTLEVISKNKKAIRAYEKAGFNLRPTLLHCYAGQPTINISQSKNITVKKTKNPDFPFYKLCRDFDPTWEMKESALNIFPDEFEYHEIFLDNIKIGYLIFFPSTSSIQQFAIHKEYRNKGFGKIIFKNLMQEYPTIRVNNVPETAVNTVTFLNNIGMQNHVDQYEMERPL